MPHYCPADTTVQSDVPQTYVVGFTSFNTDGSLKSRLADRDQAVRVIATFYAALLLVLAQFARPQHQTATGRS